MVVIYNEVTKIGWASVCSAVAAIFSVIVAIIAIYFSAKFNFYQIITAQFSEKAKNANGYLIGKAGFPRTLADEANNDGFNPGPTPKTFMDFSGLSGVYSEIITAKQLFESNFEGKWFSFFLLLLILKHKQNKQRFIDQFYLSLHTSIRCHIKNSFSDFKKVNRAESKEMKVIKSIDEFKEFKKSFHEIACLKIETEREIKIEEELKSQGYITYFDRLFHDIGINKKDNSNAYFIDELTLLTQILEAYLFFEKSINKFDNDNK
ncbi:MAG: hypothetical protein WC860_02545 [Candidatus Margulisiibacteriota bacterium]|jgi:hypothetical protein